MPSPCPCTASRQAWATSALLASRPANRAATSCMVPYQLPACSRNRRTASSGAPGPCSGSSWPHPSNSRCQLPGPSPAGAPGVAAWRRASPQAPKYCRARASKSLLPASWAELVIAGLRKAGSWLGNTQGLADHQRPGQGEQQHHRVQLPRADLPLAEPDFLADGAGACRDRQHDHQYQAGRDRGALEIRDLALVARHCLGGDVVARQAADAAADEIAQHQPVPPALHATGIGQEELDLRQRAMRPSSPSKKKASGIIANPKHS
ncbi:hypothetical protein G6F57_018054 [Rhizopus arrhizus]|nr:hypothetical protein G6F57_018054 [Rhizopus arrhizus]